LNGFIINEQQIFLSKESVENLMRYNGFPLTFGTLIIVNIMIRQIMINIVAIYMHHDYHKGKKKAKELQNERSEVLKAKIEL